MRIFRREKRKMTRREQWENLIRPVYRARGGHMAFHGGAMNAAVSAALSAGSLDDAIDAVKAALDCYAIQPGDTVAPVERLTK